MKKILMILLFAVFSYLNANQIVKSSGEVLINGKKLEINQEIKLGDFIQTKSKSRVIFNIGKSAFLANENSKFQINKNGSTQTLNIIAGGALAVFQHGDEKHEVKTPNMTAGIRGTGVYAQVEDGKSYFCTCYGETELVNIHNHDTIELKATHHNMVWVTPTKIKSESKMIFHNDEELRELEAMVGRIPDFDK